MGSRICRHLQRDSCAAMNVAEMYPARADASGVTWYRPAFDGGSPPSMWGWTSQPDQAHPDYFVHEADCDGPEIGPDIRFCSCNEPSGRDDPTSISNLMVAGPPRRNHDRNN